MRDYPVQDKYRKNIIFLIWSCILTRETENKLLLKSIESLKELFCIRYSPSCNTKRIYLIYLTVNLLISNTINYDVPLTNNISKIQNIIKKCDNCYKEIKKCEENYFSGGHAIEETGKTAIDKSMDRINLVLGKFP